MVVPPADAQHGYAMDTINIAAFIEAIRCGSINKAAEKLGYTQSGLTYMFNSLEAEIGVKLLKRAHNGISLTQEGALLFPYIEAVIEKEAVMNSTLKRIRTRTKQPIRIGIYSSWLLQVIPDVTAAFAAEHPGTEFEFRTGVMTLDGLLDSGMIDLAICEESVLREKKWEFITEDETCVAIRSDSPLAKKDVVTLRELSEYKMVPSVNRNSTVFQAFESAGLAPNKAMSFYSEDGSMMLSMVSRNNCITFVSKLSAVECPYNVCLLRVNPPIIKRMGVSVSAVAENRREVRQFVNFIKKFDYSGY